MLIALCRCLAAAIPALPPSSLDLLAAQDVLGLLYVSLITARQSAQSRVVQAVMNLAATIVFHATDANHIPKTNSHTIRRGLVQARVREMRFLDEALAAIVLFDGESPVVLACLAFLRAAVEDNVQNVVELGMDRETNALQLILSCAARDMPDRRIRLDDESRESSDKSSSREKDDMTRMLCAVCDLAAECSKVLKNFETMLGLGLTVTLVDLLGKVTSSVSHVIKTLELMDRSIRTSEEEGRSVYVRAGAAAVTSCMREHRHDPRVQEVGIRALISMIEVYERNRESAAEAEAVQAVHFALTEHSKDAQVVGVSCKLLLLFSPFHLMSGSLQIQELKKLLRARFKAHKDDEETAMDIDDLATSLDLISHQSVRAIDDFLNGGSPERSGGLSSVSLTSMRLRSSRGTHASSFRISFHRRGRHRGHGHGGEGNRPRRAKSDFNGDISFQPNPQESPEQERGSRLRGSRLREYSWLDFRRKWPSESNELHNALQPSQEDALAYEPLFETLTRYRESQHDPVSCSSSYSVGRLGHVLERTSGELRLFIRGGHKNHSTAPLNAGSPGEIDWLGNKSERRELRREIQTLVEKRVGPIVRTRRRSDGMRIEDMNFDAVESNSGRSEVDLGEDDSLFSFSGSDADSAADATWRGEDGSNSPAYLANLSGKRNGSGRVQSVKHEDTVDSDSDLEEATISPQTKEPVVAREGGGRIKKGGRLVSPLMLDESMGDEDDEFPELEMGKADSEESGTSSGGSQAVVSVMTDSMSHSNSGGSNEVEDGRAELVPQAQKYGERERVRSENARNSGNWGPPKESIWPLISIDNGIDAHRGSPVQRAQARGESGSLTLRR
eukprot:GFKZ01000808.1.p1 GENE.GFKZ01000808.1~~GFKZ01000808.1.p1  ORF type:complete len:844 (+),score=118.02 GFKZ01000808.1:672-3203(+)